MVALVCLTPSCGRNTGSEDTLPLTAADTTKPREAVVVATPTPNPISATPVAAETAAPTPAPPPPLVLPIASNGAALLQGLPTNPSKLTTLDVTLSGATIVKYQYALISDSSSCNGVSYSTPKLPSLNITDTLGTDGTKTLCVIAITKVDGEDPKASALSYSWIKDSTAPSVSFTANAGFGPAAQSGSSFDLVFTATDTASPLANAQFSLSNGTNCLNATFTAFDALCPQLITAASPSSGTYKASIPDSLFSHGASYVASAWVSDSVGNIQSTAATQSFTWDSVGPADVASLSLTKDQQDVSLSWPAVTGATRYIVVRREELAVSVTPAAGTSPAADAYLGNDNFVACNTSSTSCSDQDLEAYRHYHYQVIAFDDALNRSASGPRSSIQTSTKPVFQGINRAYLVSPNRTITAEWQKFVPSGASASSLTYGLFASSTANTEDFVTPVVSALNKDSLSYADSSAANNLYLRARQWDNDLVQDDNLREIRIKMGAGVHHKLSASGRFSGQDPLAQAYLRSAWALAIDPFGNLVFGGAQGTVNVICKESSLAYYCKGRTLGKIFTFAGTDGADDGADGVLASASAMGEPYGIAFDSAGNMYIADSTNFRIRVVCYAPDAAGACNGKTQGFSYHLAGTGSSVDGLDDSVAKSAGIGLPNGIGVHSMGNIYFSDSTFRKIRMICLSTAQSPCLGKVYGNLYTIVGTGIVGDAADNLPGVAANVGTLGTMALDSLGNIYFSDTTNFRLRAFCLTVTGSNHFCASKTVGNLYRVTGTGVTGDGANDVAASTAQIATVNGISISAAGNIFFSDNSVAGNRLRVLCFNSSGDYLCTNATVGNTYRTSGTGASTDGASNVLAVAVSIGSPRGLARDSAGNMFFADPTNRRIRLHCVSAVAGGFCDGMLADYHYQLAGAGASSLGWNLDAFLTPMGLPQGIAEDAFGNIYLGDATNFVARVICYDVVSNGFCKSKTFGVSYIIAGNGVTGNAADNVLAIANSIGTITAVEVDSSGNLYLADNTNRTIRLVCATTTGPCAGRSVGNMYRFIGNTTAIDTSDGGVAFSNGLGQVADMAFDTVGNMWIADAQYFRVRLYCFNTSSTCSGRTAGNIYRIAGTGITGNAADAVTASTAALGTLTSLDVDLYDNVLLGDASNFYVRVICNNASGGYCATKATPSGRIYRAIGTGLTGDAVSDTTASATAISAMNAVQADPLGNIYIAESTNRRIRILCLNVSSGYCTGLTAGNTYRAYGSALAGDASSGTSGSVARIDTPSRDGLHFSASNGHLIYAGGGTPATLGNLSLFLSN